MQQKSARIRALFVRQLNMQKDSRKAAQGMQSLVQNTVTHDAPDIHVPGVFSLTERTYGFASYRSAHYVCSINLNLAENDYEIS